MEIERNQNWQKREPTRGRREDEADRAERQPPGGRGTWRRGVKPGVSLLGSVPVAGAHRIPDSVLEEHMRAYRKARWYHATKPTAVPSILQQGLRPDMRGTAAGAEAISNPSEVEAAKKDPAVFLGGDISTTRYYNRQLKQAPGTKHLRAFRTPEEEEWTREDFGDEKNVAYRTPRVVGPQGLIYGRLRDSPSRLDEVFDAVRQHYPGGGQNISVDQVRRLHGAAIARGKTTHRRGQKSGKDAQGGERRYQYDDEGYVSD